MFSSACRSLLFLCSVFVALFLLCLATRLEAQTQTDHERRLKEGLDRLESRLAPVKERNQTYLQKQQASTGPEPQEQPEARCFQVKTIQVDGVTLFTPEQINTITASYQDQCLSLNAINQLVEALSTLYLDSGYVTSRAFVQPQNLADGQLELVVLEGRAEQLISAENQFSQRELDFAFPALDQRLLNIRDIEQGLENLNALAKNSATVDLRPGQQQGGTIVAIQNQPQEFAWRGGLGIDDSGNASTGLYQVDANLSVDNSVGINDNLYLSAATSAGSHSLPQSDSDSYALHWSFPLDYWRFSAQTQYYKYLQMVIGNLISFQTSGSSLNHSIRAERVLWRGQQSKWTSQLTLIRKSSKNYVEDVFLDTSSRKIYVANLGLAYQHKLSQGEISLGLNIERSVPWFGAKTELASAEDDFQFTKYMFDMNYSSQFELGSQPFYWRSAASYLYSPKIILASEGMAVGSRYTVRGVNQGSLFGYKGGYIRNDLTAPVSWALTPDIQHLVSVHLDLGMTNLPDFENFNADWLASAGLGYQMVFLGVSTQIAYHRTLRVPGFMASDQHEAIASIRFNF